MKKAKRTQPRRLARLPVLRPGTYTADKVLEHVAKIIEAEPERLDMRFWLRVWRGRQVEFNNYVVRAKARLAARRRRLPACGTVACVAGWINTVTKNTDYSDLDLDDVRALHKLGIDEDWSRYGNARVALSNLFYRVKLTPEQVAEELRNIAAIWRAEFSTTKVVVPPGAIHPPHAHAENDE